MKDKLQNTFINRKILLLLFYHKGSPGASFVSKKTIHELSLTLPNQRVFTDSTSLLLCCCLSPAVVSVIQMSLLSLLIFCSLSVSADGEGATTLEEPCLDTICAALALHAHHHMMTLASMHHPQQHTGAQECMYTTHRHLQRITLTTLDRCSYTNNLPE